MFFLCIGISVNAQSVRIEKDGFKWIPYLQYGKMGAMTPSEDIIIPAKYEECFYRDGHFYIKDNYGNHGIMNQKGKQIVPPKYTFIYEVSGYEKGKSPYIVVNGNGYGLYSNDGKMLIPATYLSIQSFMTPKGNYYIVIDRNSYSGIAIENGEWLIPPTKYNHIDVRKLRDEVFFSYLIYGKDRCSGVLDSKGKEIVSTNYSFTYPVLDTSGNLYFKIQHGLSSTGTMDVNGNITKAPNTKETYTSSVFGKKNIYVTINEKGLWGIADENKKIQIPCKYDYINLTYPYFTVREGQYMGLYDEAFNPIITTSDKYITVVKTGEKEHGGYIIAKTAENKEALYTLQGKKLSDAIHQHMSFHIFNTIDNRKDTVLNYYDNGMWGCEDLQHKTIFPPRYQDLNFMETSIGNFYTVFQNNLVGLCNSDGIEIIAPQYTSITFTKFKDNSAFFYAKNGVFTAVFTIDGVQLINGETFSNIWYDEGKSQFIATQGKRKCYFSKDGMLLSDNALDIEQDKYISLADDYFEKGKYKSAAKNYGLAINLKPTASLYFNRGVSYYNMNKYNNAISDFKSCLDNNPSQHLITRSLELIDKAEEYQFQKEQNRAQIANAIFGIALTGANMYFQAQAQKQRTKYTSQGTTSSPKAYSSSEDDEDSSTPTGSSSKQCPSLKVNRGKWYCANTGVCAMCGGDGLMDSEFGEGANTLKCTLCGGSGKCKYCQ